MNIERSIFHGSEPDALRDSLRNFLWNNVEIPYATESASELSRTVYATVENNMRTTVRDYVGRFNYSKGI